MATRRDILNKLDIKPEDWVLEIGSGPSPFERSDILADKFSEDNTQRSGQLTIDRPLIVCDAHYLPFVDKSFDYIFASQVLEHLEEPELFFAEIERVGKKGYIESPNGIRELLFGWPFHRWVVEKDKNDYLILRKNDLDQPFGLFFHKLQLENHEFARFCALSHDLLNTCYEWHGKVMFGFEQSLRRLKEGTEKIFINADEIVQHGFHDPYTLQACIRVFIRVLARRVPKRLKVRTKKIVSPPHYGYRHSNSETWNYLIKVLACPVCKTKAVIKEDEVICPQCGRVFERRDIPVMLPG